MPFDHGAILDRLRELQRSVRDRILSLRGQANLHFTERHLPEDTIYRLDEEVEATVVAYCEEWGAETPLVLIAEGLGSESQAFPRTRRPEDALLRVLLDPIDGTRGLMYDKRPAWCLAGAALNRGPQTKLSDIEVAVMTELPTSKMNQADVLWSVRGQGASGLRQDLTTGCARPLPLVPSQATNLDHGFASVSSFFPGTKRLAAELVEFLSERLAQSERSPPLLFDDQYIATGGQLYELVVGHDRLIVDLRRLFSQMEERPLGLCVHPYDLSTMLIAQEAGVVLTDAFGRPLDGPVDLHTPLDWCGYANERLRELVEPVIQEFLRQADSRQGRSKRGG
jgi:fructose-1,6-bisphosphatase/inositol monophosphatase family enzyme